MSATRIVRRVAWGDHNPSGFAYHSWLTVVGLRHPTFQRKIRATRLAMGFPPTSTDMHHVHGDKL